jgi:hypothetical protein
MFYFNNKKYRIYAAFRVSQSPKRKDKKPKGAIVYER